MNEKDLKNKSETDWARLEAMTDDEIDTSDIPPLDEKFFANAKLRMPKDKVSVLVNVGIPATLADELEADTEALEAAISAKAGAQMETVGATAGIDAEIERGMTAEKILDSIMHNVYFDNPVKLAEWKTARHVKKSPQKKEEEEPTG